MSKLPTISAGDGVARPTLSDYSDPMVVAFWFLASRAIGAMHCHPHVRTNYVEGGLQRFKLEDHEQEFGHVGSFVIASGHSNVCKGMEPGKMNDCFSLRRDEIR
ncbi:cupin [uncultured Shimia sp.]|uniref:cupin n=1 Tax=uncultured Shimia sp. TaxID=573152 RepID=UPI002620CB79|nr:cupin [uncultured Shimia sp.]